jgi:hypothetical protein
MGGERLKPRERERIEREERRGAFAFRLTSAVGEASGSAVTREAKKGKVVLNKAGAASVGSPFPSVAPSEFLHWAIIGETTPWVIIPVSVLAATVRPLASVHMPHKAGLWTTTLRTTPEVSPSNVRALRFSSLGVSGHGLER